MEVDADGGLVVGSVGCRLVLWTLCSVGHSDFLGEEYRKQLKKEIQVAEVSSVPCECSLLCLPGIVRTFGCCDPDDMTKTVQKHIYPLRTEHDGRGDFFVG